MTPLQPTAAKGTSAQQVPVSEFIDFHDRYAV